MPLTRAPYAVCLNIGNVTWTNQPAALTELFGVVHRRIRVDLTDTHKIRLSLRVSTASASGSSSIFAQYSTDESSWQTLTTNTVPLTTPAGTKASAWEAVPAGARGDIFVRIVGTASDSTGDPVIGNLYVEYR